MVVTAHLYSPCGVCRVQREEPVVVEGQIEKCHHGHPLSGALPHHPVQLLLKQLRLEQKRQQDKSLKNLSPNQSQCSHSVGVHVGNLPTSQDNQRGLALRLLHAALKRLRLSVAMIFTPLTLARRLNVYATWTRSNGTNRLLANLITMMQLKLFSIWSLVGVEPIQAQY